MALKEKSWPQTVNSKLLNRNSAIPIYHQLFEVLRDRILSQEWKSGDLLPSESALMEMYKVSRITVRQAVEILAGENLVYKQQGKGTFVTFPTLRTDAMQIIGFENDMLRRGLKPATKLLYAGIVTASVVTAEKLKIQTGDELAQVKRLRFADEIPISLEDVFLVHRYFPGILEGHNYEKESIYDVLDKNYGVQIKTGEQTISAMVAPKNLRDILQNSKNQALLYIERISYSQFDIPVEMRHIYYRADRYALQLSVKR